MEVLDVAVNNPEEPVPAQVYPMIIRKVHQPQFGFLVDLAALLRILFNFLGLKPLLYQRIRPVGVVAGSTRVVDATVESIGVKNHHPFALAGDFPIAVGAHPARRVPYLA